MTSLDVGLRGGAIALLLLLAISGYRDGRHDPVIRYTIPFDLCAVAYLLETAPSFAMVSAWWIAPIRVLSNATPAVFVLWTSASFDDAFVPRWWRWLPFGGMIVLAAFAVGTDWQPLWQVAHLVGLLLVFVGLWQTLAGRSVDLVEERRRIRLALAITIGIWIATITVFGATPALRPWASVISAGGVLTIAATVALLRLQLRPWPARAAVSSPEPAPVVDPADTALLNRLQALMERERIYREEGFGISVLATRLGLPEYRLRRLINQRLGHRNFTSFVNGYRLAETMAALADPGQAQVPVLTIALDAGFQSIGPFNRAFKAHTGLTPTEYRRTQRA